MVTTMDDQDRDDFAFYGNALDPIEDDDTNVRKKPVALQDQIVTDERGRRRFHGAFTGGFSAGYFNTVGSKEGWKPATFKSSRSDRTGARGLQNVQDFMDEEDMGSFGIAPTVLRPTDEFSQKKREVVKTSGATTGPIPGDPVLIQIIQPAAETAGVRILRKLGWRPGQGIGPKEKKKRRKRKPENEVEIVEEHVVGARTYGCSLPSVPIGSSDSDDEEMEYDDEYLRFAAPKDVDSPVYNPKDNKFGLGYKGLDRNAIGSSHVNLFGPALKFRVDDKNMNIAGEAFGIGVFEDKDEEVYSRDDMTQYDFALETAEERKARLKKESRSRRKRRFSFEIPGYHHAKNPTATVQYFAPPTLPPDFQPVHAKKTSRFSSDPAVEEDVGRLRGLDRHKYTRDERSVILDDQPPPLKKLSELSSCGSSSVPTKTPPSETAKAIAAEQENRARVERLQKFAEVLQKHSTDKGTSAAKVFKPFASQPEKQERYEKYLTLKAAGYGESLKDLQPSDMTEWEKARERGEFDRAAVLYKPMANEISSRFVSAKSHDISHLAPDKEVVLKKDPSDDPQIAAKMNMFGKLTHRTHEWRAHNVVCKRFNVPNPFPNCGFVGLVSAPTKLSKTEVEQEPPVPAPVDEPKKSLFANLDFSKPPPGLYPTAAASTVTTDLEDSRTEFAASLDEVSAEPQSSNEIAAQVVSVSEPVVKPPMDLFKEIFADTSESEADEEPEPDPIPPPPKTVDKKMEVPSRVSIVDSQTRAQSTKVDEKLSDPLKNKPSVFDNLDFNIVNKTANSAPAEDEEDLYGPVAPLVQREKPLGGSSGLAHRHIFSIGKKKSETLKDKDGLWVEKLETKSEIPESPKRKASKKKKKHKTKSKKHKGSSSEKKKKKHKKSDKSKKRRKRSSSESSSSDSQAEASDSSSSDELPISMRKVKDPKAVISVLRDLI